MNQSSQTSLPEDSALEPKTTEDATGLPGFETWSGVYWFVISIFIVCVVLLKVFELVFS